MIVDANMDSRADKLRRRQAHFTQCMAEFKQWAASGYEHEKKPPSRPFPDDLRDIRCEAKTRAGTPCKRKDIYRNGRCKYHGGKSTGAKTAEGKARQLEGYRMWQERQKRVDSDHIKPRKSKLRMRRKTRKTANRKTANSQLLNFQ